MKRVRLVLGRLQKGAFLENGDQTREHSLLGVG